MNNHKKTVIIVAGFILLSALAGLATYGFYRNSHSATVDVAPYSTTTVDPITKQQIDDYASHTSENYGTNPASPSLIGFAAMLNQGLTQTDLTTFQDGINNYFVSSGEIYPPSPVVVLSNAVCGFPQDNGTVDCTYTLTVNEKTEIQGKLRTGEDAGGITIELTDSSGTLYKKTMSSSSN